ncbi:cysteine hydrolase [Cutibacterium sp. WCA-380-WT-3A]|uniref:Cysteine hydrolase n=1 Tax=Cutibacterium porci TaxID=2605781 RepID=A0A7K0J9Y0_9ACTN|nr:isochorismatase family protein [Cutibacterium porci]MSS46680.1 cysteine hydrolase [Cutibacterium porci]
MSEPWLIVIDPQMIFASPTSPWCCPTFPDIIDPINHMAAAFRGRTVVTRWIPATIRHGSWRDYFDRWTFADRPASDPMFNLAHGAQEWVERPTVDVTTFGKWGSQLSALTGDHPHLVLTGVSTDCCVLTTALAAADAGAWVTVASDACAGSAHDNHRAALTVMNLYAPQIDVTTSSRVLETLT